MSYSINDSFYIDTETSTSRLQGNLDLQNSIRFNKTDTDEGIVIQANIINERLVESFYIPNEFGTQFNTRIIDNVLNSNVLQLQLVDTYISSDNHTQLIFQIENTDLTNTVVLLLLGNNYISIPPGYKICYKLDTTFHNYESSTSYIPYAGKTYQHRSYFQGSNNNASTSSDYFIGFAYGSNNFLKENVDQQILLETPMGYFTKRSFTNNRENSIYLKCDGGSYFTDGLIHTSNEIVSCIYRNLSDLSLKLTDINLTPVYDPQITIPTTQNNYYILLFSHLGTNPNQYSFIKYLRTSGNTTVVHYPRLMKSTSGFICYFLTRTDPLTPISIYSLKYNNGIYSYVQDTVNNINISIPGTSLSDTYQYVFIHFDNYGVYKWHIRIVLKTLNKNITDPIYAIHHQNDEFTVSIINQTLTDIIIYNANKSTTILTHINNILIHFTKDGNYRWSTKYMNITSIQSHKSILTSYSSNTFFMNLLSDYTIGDTTSIYNSDGTIFNNFTISENTFTNSLIYYDINGKVKHENRYTYDYLINDNQNLQTCLTTNENNNTIVYTQQNKSINLNSTVNYIDAFLNITPSFIYANSIHLNYYDLVSESVGQKQLSFGNNLRVLNLQADELNIRGNLYMENDLSLNQLMVSSNLLLSLNSKIGIGTLIPRTAFDIQGDAIINGKIGVGTDILNSRFNITTVNENPISINNQSIQFFPTTGFFTNGYTKLGSIASIDNSNDVVEYPPPFGASYAGDSIFLASSQNNTTSNSVSKAFDKNPNGDSWMTLTTKYDSTTGLPTAGAASTVVSSVTTNGEWIQIYNTRKLQLINYTIYSTDRLSYATPGVGYGTPMSRPGSWIVAGSLNNSQWFKVDERINYRINTASNFTVNSATQYFYYRLIITKAAPYTGPYTNPSPPTPPAYGTGITINEINYFLNLSDTAYPEYKFNTVNYKVKANSIYHFGYNDSNLYLPTNLLDNTNVGYWRSGSNNYTYTSQGRETIIEIDLHTKRTINQFTLYGINNLTYPTKWIFEGFNDPGSNWSVLDTRSVDTNTITTLTNTYNLSSSLDAYKFRFKFYRNNSTYPNFLELQRISLNSLNYVKALHIDSTNNFIIGGKAGIGTTTPNSELHVVGTIEATTQFLGNVSDTVSTPSFSWKTDTYTGIYHAGTNMVGVVTNGGERIRVIANGNVGIGTTIPLAKLSVQGNITASADVIAFGSASDVRLKNSIENLESGLNIINQLRPVKFKWNDDIPNKYCNKIDYGFIAQEVEYIIPEITDIVNLGIIYDPIKIIHYEKITTFLVKAIQEQQQQINELRKMLQEK